VTNAVDQKSYIDICSSCSCRVHTWTAGSQIYSKVNQVGPLSQTIRAAACISFGKNITAKRVHLTSLYPTALTPTNDVTVYVTMFELNTKLSTAAAPSSSSLNAQFTFQGRPPPIIFARIVRSMNALQLCRIQFSHKETL